MRLEDAPVGTSIQINSKTFIKIAANQYMQKAPICHIRVWDFDYTGTEQTWIAPVVGTYKLEVWGAQGGSYSGTGGYGGYSVGILNATTQENVHIAVGGIGGNIDGGYNGGGNRVNNDHGFTCGAGGGATHLALVSGQLKDLSSYKDSAASNQSKEILIVAGGGGGACGRDNYSYRGGNGGGYHGVGVDSQLTMGGSQDAGGINHNDYRNEYSSSFGQGSTASNEGGGGGGWYGGGAGRDATIGYGGGGGSGYINSPNLVSTTRAIKHMTCYDCTTSSDNATRTQSNTCVSNNPTADCSKIGHGHARITLLTASGEDCYIPECPSGTAYSAKHGDCKPLASFTEITQVIDYAYAGEAQTFSVPTDGIYKLEAWGANGGEGTTTYIGGRGGYVSGHIQLASNTELYIYVGSSGIQGVKTAGGYNGGGNSCNQMTTCGSGGGATDIRIIKGNLWNSIDSLRSRIMVAGAGGGGAIYSESGYGYGGAGGGLTGSDGTSSWAANKIGGGGTQVGLSSQPTNESYLVSGTFGIGDTGYQGSANRINGAGGGGWYGGRSGGDYGAAGGGGSSYISGHTGCVAVTSLSDTTPKSGCTTGTTDNSCSLSPTGKRFTNTVMIDGAGYAWTNTKGSLQAMPNPAGGYYNSGTGHSGNGFVRITRLEVPANDCGLHATLTGTNTCTCASGYYADASGSTTTGMGGSCLYQKCGSNTTSEYAIACTCSDGYYANTEGTSTIAAAGASCVTCPTDTVYNPTVNHCMATTMQAFTTAMCDAFATPTGTNYTTVGTLIDSRDGKAYTIHKFADGHCWMAENLKFGNCSEGKWTGTADGYSYGAIASGYYGACSRYSTYDGYYYNWQAAVQDASSYYGKDNQPLEPRQGICPTGWYLPAQSGAYSFTSLYNAVGSDKAFFQPGGNFGTIYAGYFNTNSSAPVNAGNYALYWTSSQLNANSAHDWDVLSSGAHMSTGYKTGGFTVRCVANSW